MTNSEIFVDFYNKIDSFLKKNENLDSGATFTHRIKNSENKVVKRNKVELISLGELRNAIVHSPRIGAETIAEPHTEIVKRIEELYHLITSPKKVYPEFSFKVLGAKKDDFINEILITMKKESFSQFPVFDDNKKVIELINTNTISRWLSSQLMEDGGILAEEIKVGDLINEIEFKENYKFIGKDASVYDAYDLFINQINEKKRNLDVIFITEKGNQNEKILGLITIEDISNMV